MTHKVKLHVGYIGETRAGERVEIVDNNGMEMWPWVGSDGEWYADDGSYDIDSHTSLQDIIGPWHDAPDVGQWVGWNGGPCPVHPETVVECVWHNGTITVQNKMPASDYVWDGGNYQTIAYRIITPYIEPKKAREFWFCKDNIDIDYYKLQHKPNGNWNEVIHVREVLDDD